MQKFDIILLTASKYMVEISNDPLVRNVLEEDQIVTSAFEQLGLLCGRIAWDDPNFDWSSAQLVLVRTPWDYFDRYNEFLSWFKSASSKTRFINSKELIEWNIDKHYLLDLNKSGIHIPNTLFLKAGAQTTLKEYIEKAKDENGFVGDEFVLKPCIGGGAWHTYKFHSTDCNKYEGLFNELIAHQSMMLQEFQHNIVTHGEISIMVIDGIFTHAVLKLAKPGEYRVQDDYGGSVQAYRPNSEEIKFAEAVVGACTELPMYARVDIFEDNGGQLALAELEIFEPELWFRLQPNAAYLLAKRIHEKYVQ